MLYKTQPVIKLTTNMLAFIILLLASPSVFSSPKVLIYGDSVGAGLKNLPEGRNWFEILQKQLETSSPGINIINESVRGRTTTEGLSHLTEVLNKHEPDLVILELGANDALQGQELKMIKGNLISMIKIINSSGADALLVGIEIPPRHGQLYSDSFNAVYFDVAKETNVMLLPSFVKGIQGVSRLLLKDGLHPNGRAQPLLAELLRPVILPWLVSFNTQAGE